MSVQRPSSVLGGMRRLFDGGSVVANSERQLLDRFLSTRDELAFEAIVARHGPMVVGVCRSVLANSNDVDDAFQATFLVLVKKAGSLRDGDQLSPWLHGVARRVAIRARANSAKRRGRERSTPDVEATAPDRPAIDAERRELSAIIHAELDRLSLPERSAITLCDLEGLTHQEAADQLGWPLGTVKARVSRGRDRLRSRLARRGVTLSASAIASTLAGETLASAVIARSLVVATTRAALAIAAGRAFTAGLMSPSVYHLTQGAARAMIATKFKILAATLTASTVLAVPGVVAYQAQGQKLVKIETKTRVDEPKPVKVQEAIEDFRKAFNGSITSPSLEVEAKNLAILKKLEEPNPLKKVLSRFFGGSPTASLPAPAFAELMELVTEATIDPAGGLPAGIPIRFTSLGKRLAARNLGRNVEGLVAGDASTSLRVVMASEASAYNLDYRVAGGVLTLDESQVEVFGRSAEKADVRDRLQADDQRNEMIRAKLDRVVPLKFSDKVSLNVLMAYIKKVTRDGDERPIPIYVDPRVFNNHPNDLGRTADEPSIVIDLDDVPLRTSLRLALMQLRLEYAISGGLLIIGDKPANNAFMGGGGMGGEGMMNNSMGVYELVEPRDRNMGGMGGGFR